MPAFFVHGVPENHHLWDEVIALLSRDDIVAIDLPGFGAPAPDDFDGTKEAYVAWLIERIESVGQPVDLVGHDWGAMLTVRLAALRPELVRSWAGGSCAVSAGYQWHPLAKLWQTPGRGEAYFDKLDRAGMVDALEKDRVPYDDAKRIAAGVNGEMGRCILSLYRSATDVGREWQPNLARVVAPSLVLHGARDESVPPEFAEELSRDIGARDIVILDAGHWLPLEKPGEVAGALERHWSA